MRKFSPEERGIFSYFNPDIFGKDSEGKLINDGMVFSDPFQIDENWDKAKINQKSDIDIDFNNLDLKAPGFDPEGDAPDPFEKVKMQALRNLLPFIHEVFGTKPMAPDGSGITFEEAWENLQRYNVFAGSVKKNTDETPNPLTSSPEPTEKSPNGKNTSDSISTKVASSPSGLTR